MAAQAPKINNDSWVAAQYKTPSNLNARIQLHQRFSTNPHPWTQWLFERLQLTNPMQLLEIGGGPGNLWLENRQQLLALPKVGITFTDQSTGMIAQAISTLGDLPHFRFGVADAQTLPFATASFDVIVANHMLYHVPDRGKALAEIRRVLRPQGRFFAATNDRTHMQELHDLAEAFMPGSLNPLSTLEPLLWLPQPQQNINERFPFDVATEELSQHFGQVQLHRYHNKLVVTDADALADYMLSGLSINLPAVAETPFRHWLQSRIQAQGAITITPTPGLFEATTAYP